MHSSSLMHVWPWYKVTYSFVQDVPRLSVLQAMESWAGPGNEAT